MDSYNLMKEIRDRLDSYYAQSTRDEDSFVVVNDNLVRMRGFSKSLLDHPSYSRSSDIFFSKDLVFMEDKATEYVSGILSDSGMNGSHLKVVCHSGVWDAANKEGTFTIEVRLIGNPPKVYSFGFR